MSQITLFPLRDSNVLKFTPEFNYSSQSELYIGRFTNEDTIYRMLMYFDLSQIPKASLIKRARLCLYIERNEIPKGSSIDIQTYSVEAGFEEDKVTWANQPDPTKEFYSWYELKSDYLGNIELDMTHAVRGWVHGWFSNNGILVSGNENINSLVGFYSKEYFDSSLRPKLVIDYEQERNSYYSDETLEFKGVETKYSHPIPLAAAEAISFFVATDNEITAVLQVSKDGINYYNVYFNYISSSNPTVLSTDIPCIFARLELASSKDETVVSICPIVKV